jgi:hypothetical protein
MNCNISKKRFNVNSIANIYIKKYNNTLKKDRKKENDS